MPTENIKPISQNRRIPCSLPLADADLSLGNANWTKGLQAMSDWIWSGQLNPVRFPNNLARYFLHIPGVFEQQLNFSTTLIFDEPSYRNGVQVSGMIDRVMRELVINLIAQCRCSWYSITHHAILGFLTAQKHGVSDNMFATKYLALLDKKQWEEVFSPVEREILIFADAFCTNPKAYTDAQFVSLRTALMVENRARYATVSLWQKRLEAARTARARALLETDNEEVIAGLSASAADSVSNELPDDQNDLLVNAQIVELAFLCHQFVALTDVFTSLNIPDEDFLPDVMTSVLSARVISRINDILESGAVSKPLFVPPEVQVPLEDILSGNVVVEPAPLRGRRIPLESYEVQPQQALRDKGLAVGGVQVGVWGWSFGMYFPGSLPYALMHHPELARFEAPYSLPLLFNEDEWRNGTQTAGFVSRRLKELLIQKVYRIVRTRYGIEHHTMFLYNTFLDEHGVGRLPAGLSIEEQKSARLKALERAANAVLQVQHSDNAPLGVFNRLETAAMAWAYAIVCNPHQAHLSEPRLREALEEQNRREIASGLHALDREPGIGEKAALKRLQDHQIAEMAMVVGHMDGLGRLLTMLQLESEEGVQDIRGTPGRRTIVPELDANGEVQYTGYMTARPGLFQVLQALQVDAKVLTCNELMVNPKLCDEVNKKLAEGKKKIRISADEALRTGEF